MTIERYTSVVAVLVAGLFLVNAFVPEAAFATGTAPTTPPVVQCPAPVNSWFVPATSGPANCVQYTNNLGQSTTLCPVPRPAYALGQAIGSILALPFDAARYLLGSCP